MSLMSVVDVFNKIKSTSSRTGKEAILRENEDNIDFRRILEFIYNPFVLTGIKAKKLKKFENYYDENSASQMGDVFDLIDFIAENNSGRDEDIKVVANFINDHLNEEVKCFLRDMFTKEFKCGITASTINKVYGKGAIPEFDVLLAKSYKDHSHKLKGKFFITLKLDGIRCVAIKENGKVKFFTRQGQPIDDLVDVEAELSNYPDNMVYDGELLLINENNLPSDELFRATQKVVRKDGVKRNIIFHLFDIVPLNEFVEGKSKLNYEQRREVLNKLLAEYEQLFVRTLPILYEGDDKDVISDLLTEVIAEGHEGLMVNVATGYYVTKRSDVLLKVKEMYTIDLQVVGYEEGNGKFEGTLGALIVDYKGYKVKVGSGYSEEDRESIWSMKDDIVGRVIEVQYFEESSNQDGGTSLRFPVYKGLREDGKKVSYD